MLNNGEENRTSDHGEDEESRESHIVLEEIGEVVIVEEDEEEGNECDEDDEDQGVEETPLELLVYGV